MMEMLQEVLGPVVPEMNSSMEPKGSTSMAKIDQTSGYIINIDDIRREEYPMLHGES